MDPSSTTNPQREVERVLRLEPMRSPEQDSVHDESPLARPWPSQADSPPNLLPLTAGDREVMIPEDVDASKE